MHLLALLAAPEGGVDQVVALAALTAFVFALIGFAKVVRNRDLNAALTTLAWWVGGVVGVLIFAQTAWADHIVLLGVPMGSASTWDLIVIGICPGSFGIVINEGKKAIDNTQTTSQPALIRSSPGQAVGTDPALAPPPPGVHAPFAELQTMTQVDESLDGPDQHFTGEHLSAEQAFHEAAADPAPADETLADPGAPEGDPQAADPAEPIIEEPEPEGPKRRPLRG